MKWCDGGGFVAMVRLRWTQARAPAATIAACGNIPLTRDACSPVSPRADPFTPTLSLPPRLSLPPLPHPHPPRAVRVPPLSCGCIPFATLLPCLFGSAPSVSDSKLRPLRPPPATMCARLWWPQLPPSPTAWMRLPQRWRRWPQQRPRRRRRRLASRRLEGVPGLPQLRRRWEASAPKSGSRRRQRQGPRRRQV